MSLLHHDPSISRIIKLAAGSLVSISISALTTAIMGARATPETSHLLFIVIAAIVGLLFGAKAILRRLDAGFVLVFFLSEPVGRMLLRREAPHSDCLLALLLAFAVAFYLGKDGSQERFE